MNIYKNLSLVAPVFAFAILASYHTATAFPVYGGADAYEVKKFEGNGNYYMLVDRRYLVDQRKRTLQRSLTWRTARQLARSFSYDGVQGRLIKLTSPELEMFVNVTFRPSTDFWIGVNYNCNTKRMEYEDGTPVPRGGYTHWHPVDWGPATSAGTPLCNGPGAYLGGYVVVDDERAPYWRLRRWGKEYFQFIVEFPVSDKKDTEETADASPPAANN